MTCMCIDCVRLRNRARNAVQVARAHGDLVKPAQCESCGASPDSRHIHAHHTHGYDAANMLRVAWLCQKCHRAAHTPRVIGCEHVVHQFLYRKEKTS